MHIVVYDAKNHPDEISSTLVELLSSVIQDGGSMGFLANATDSELTGFWNLELSRVRSGINTIFCAMEADVCIGAGILTRELKISWRHRAEVRKLMTHPKYRRHGVAHQILMQMETIARDRGVRLLMLRTEAESAASILYSKVNWILMGTVPNYATGPDGSLHSVSFFYKELNTSG